jgi:inorganic pyrophosphatase
MDSISLKLAGNLLGKKVRVVIDRPLGSRHPEWDFVYEANYGYIEGIKAPDGDNLDAYVLKSDRCIGEYEGLCVAIIHRADDDDDKLVVIPEGDNISDREIEKLVGFQEKWFKHEIIRKL